MIQVADIGWVCKIKSIRKDVCMIRSHNLVAEKGETTISYGDLYQRSNIKIGDETRTVVESFNPSHNIKRQASPIPTSLQHTFSSKNEDLTCLSSCQKSEELPSVQQRGLRSESSCPLMHLAKLRGGLSLNSA